MSVHRPISEKPPTYVVCKTEDKAHPFRVYDLDATRGAVTASTASESDALVVANALNFWHRHRA